MDHRSIPQATIERLPIYYRLVTHLKESGQNRVSSKVISEQLGIDAATIRKDLSYFGTFGKKGYGYEVDKLLYFFEKMLTPSGKRKVILIGVGNLGKALLQYKFKQLDESMEIIAAFDTNNSILREKLSVPLYDASDMTLFIKEHHVDIAILTVPKEDAQNVVDNVTNAGIKGILNFTPTRITTREGIYVQNIDLSVELQSLIYRMNHEL
ncbi:redox-sensing transcriptional repressor Rex [Abyssicoccus albus]|uniref:Redox-sensing transcriptional repressor Rex n=1 Tax=Abyssicoccus albus TaxID=1817405 RepID=A0A3N5C9I2_9BACL|nr:redox-sensing transcriptional repressor Rex [Abyssicoccus albus]RPF55235.1 redox-sensing transcriptional repressor [Abyssicoccus albus]